MNSENINIVIVGVGGQGTLLASNVLGSFFASSGYDVKVSEVHGMSQRGGSVITHVRAGKKIYSPIVDKGQADFVMAFEKLEAARALDFLNPESGNLIVNDVRIDPMPVIIGNAAYPDSILEKIKDAGVSHIDVIRAREIAQAAGNIRTENIAILGVLSKYFDISVSQWENAIQTCVKPDFVDCNMRAFKLGREAVK